MRELPPVIRVLGHPAVAGPLTGLLVLGFLAIAQAASVVPALILLLPAAWVARAAEAVQRQRDWQHAWDSMGPPSAPRKTSWVATVALGLLLAGAAWMVVSS